jgi:hypothetical protein
MLKYVQGAEQPPTELWWQKANKELVDFTTGVLSWEVKIIDKARRVLLTKTSGVTGSAGSGTEANGTPNVSIAWSTGELNIAPGKHVIQVKATTASGDRFLVRPFEIEPVG